MGYVWNTTKMWQLWDPTGRRVVVGSNVKFDESSLGSKEKLLPVLDTYRETISKTVPEIIDTPSKILGEVIEAVDDGSKGCFITGTILQEGKPNLEANTERIVEIVGEEAPKEAVGDTPDETAVILRRSTRPRTQPKLFSGMQAFAPRVGKDGEPVTFKEALLEVPIKWKEAIADKFKSHKDNGTWTSAKLPPEKRAISTKWVFKFKTNMDGSRRYKARLVVRGFEQREGIDFG